MAWQGLIQRGEFVAHLLLDLLDKVRRLGGELERRIIGRALNLKVLGDIVIRVPIAIGPDDPEFFAAELITEGLEHTYLIGEAVHPLAPLGIGFHHRLAPGVPDHAFQRHVLLDGIGPDTTGEVLLEERERTDEGLMGGVVRAKFQGRKERGNIRR